MKPLEPVASRAKYREYFEFEAAPLNRIFAYGGHALVRGVTLPLSAHLEFTSLGESEREVIDRLSGLHFVSGEKSREHFEFEAAPLNRIFAYGGHALVRGVTLPLSAHLEFTSLGES